MRVLVRTLIAVFLASIGPALAIPAVQAHAQEMQRQSAVGTGAASSHSLTISIDKMSPQYAKATSIVTVSGTLSNHTGSAIPGITVQLQTSSEIFGNRSLMDDFTAGRYQPLLETIPVADTLPKPLRNGATARWSITFPARADAYYGNNFGVYPIQVTASSATATAYQAVARTFLPFWPAKNSGAQPVIPMQVAWVWPLIDTPQQGACPQTLATMDLAGQLGSGGRLETLLQAGLSLTARDKLTWAIDPALLSDAHVMTQRFAYGGSAACTGRATEPASKAASSWLATLQTGLVGQQAFITPYGDADAAALSHSGLDANLKSAYQLGESVATQLLPNTFGNAIGTSALAAAWPVGEVADAMTVNSLAADGGVRAVVLQSGSLRSAAYPWDDAVALTTTSHSGKMPVLLADSQLTSILGAATASSSAASKFTAVQVFLAQTAMMAAEVPQYQPARSIVVAPPRRWDPSAAEALNLLQLTGSAPWLQPVGLSKLAAESRHAAESKKLVPQRLPATQVSRTELGGTYLGQVAELNSDLALYKDILFRPSQSALATLDAAAAVTASAAWRGDGAVGGWLALTKIESYLNDNENEVRLIAGKKILLAGTSGTTPVSVHNGLRVKIQVTVQATTPAGSPLSIGKFPANLTVDPLTTVTARIPLSSTAIETTTLQLQLVTTNNGSPLGTAQQMSVQVTRYGRTLLTLIAAALGVLVLTSAARWYRKRPGRGKNQGSSDRVDAGGTG